MRDSRWWRRNWKLYQPPPRTKLEIQLNPRKIILNNQLNTSWREALKPQTDGRSEFTMTRLVGSADVGERAGWAPIVGS